MTGMTTLVRSPEISDKMGSSHPWLAFTKKVISFHWLCIFNPATSVCASKKMRTSPVAIFAPDSLALMSPSRFFNLVMVTGTGSLWTWSESLSLSSTIIVHYNLYQSSLTFNITQPLSEASSIRMTSFRRASGDRLMTEWTVLKRVEKASLLKMMMMEVCGSVLGYTLIWHLKYVNIKRISSNKIAVSATAVFGI